MFVPPSVTRGVRRSWLKPKSSSANSPGALAHHILGRDVAVEQTYFVRRAGGTATPISDDCGVPRSHRPTEPQHGVQVETADVLHPHAQPPVRVIHSVHGDHVRMTDACQQAGFTECE